MRSCCALISFGFQVWISPNLSVYELSLPQLFPLRLALVWLCFALRILLRPPGCTPAEALSDSPQLSPLRLAVCLMVSGQWAFLDADMLLLIDQSACLVEPAVVELFCSFPCLCLPPH